ncbi:MAG: hypothetical protein HF967_00455 [Methanosarcinales archaeon]|nr:hypothetical protein [Methanosarcinales archaeon]
MSTYHAYSINKNIYGHECRIIVYKGDGHRNEHKFLSLIKKDKKKIEKDFKMSFSRKKHIFLCISDAINAVNLFVDKRKNGFHDIIWDVEEIIEFKKPRGRPSKNPNTSKIQTPHRKIISYCVVLKEVKENEERIAEICNKKSVFW